MGERDDVVELGSGGGLSAAGCLAVPVSGDDELAQGLGEVGAGAVVQQVPVDGVGDDAAQAAALGCQFAGDRGGDGVAVEQPGVLREAEQGGEVEDDLQLAAPLAGPPWLHPCRAVAVGGVRS